MADIYTTTAQSIKTEIFYYFTIFNQAFMNGQDARSTRNSFFVERASCPFLKRYNISVNVPQEIHSLWNGHLARS